MTTLNESLHTITDSINESGKEFDYGRHMTEIAYKTHDILHLVGDLADMKKDAVFEDGSLVTRIFKDLQKD